MSAKAILFDLDGTLTDSGEGIMNSATLALKHFNLPIPDRQSMRVIVGPPLRDSLINFGVREDQVSEAVEIFRDYYTTVGKYENKPYVGIRELLEKLKAQGHRLYVATSKPEEMALDILSKFELSQYFDMICGATLDESRDTKDAVIAYLLELNQDVTEAIMVGDTKYDVLGAKVHGIPTIGVSWGYGNIGEMEGAGASAIAHSPDELFAFLQQ